MKNKKIAHPRNSSNRKIVERGDNTQIYDHSFYWLDICGFKLVLWAQTSPLSEMMRSWKYFHMLVKCQP